MPAVVPCRREARWVFGARIAEKQERDDPQPGVVLHLRSGSDVEVGPPATPPPGRRDTPDDALSVDGSRYSGSTISTAPKPSSGPSTKKISIVMSGSTWAWLRNASTLRPVRSSIVCL
jgi:hypothetical protein